MSSVSTDIKEMSRQKLLLVASCLLQNLDKWNDVLCLKICPLYRKRAPCPWLLQTAISPSGRIWSLFSGKKTQPLLLVLTILFPIPEVVIKEVRELAVMFLKEPKGIGCGELNLSRK